MTPENRRLALDHAMREAPREACGLLIVERGREIYVPCRNLAVGSNHFILDPLGYAAAEERGEIVAVIHSHPGAPPEPSQADRVACEASGVPWHIVGLPSGAWASIEPCGYVAPLVGRTWAHGVLDCYGIVRDYYGQVLGISLPNFAREDEWWLKGQNLYLDNFAKAGFEEVNPVTLREHDVVLMQIRSQVPNHAAVYVGGNLILHHNTNRLSSRDNYADYYRRHTVKVLRYVGTAEYCSNGRAGA